MAEMTDVSLRDERPALPRSLMPRFWRYFQVVFLALVFCGTGMADAPDWMEVRSPHFSVVTDAGQKRGREVAQRFEQMRSVFGALFLREKINTPVPLQIIAFRTEKEFRDFAPLWHGKPIRLSGLYQPGPDRNFILLDCSAEDPYAVVFHEYAHLLLNGNYPPTQPWFDEGFAEFYSTIKVKGESVEIGYPPEYATFMLRGSRWMSVADLFAVRRDSAIYNQDNDHRSLFYAESWLVVHYLFDQKKLKEAGDYFDQVMNQHVPVPQAIHSAFGVDVKQFDHALESSFNGGIKVFTFPVPPLEYNDFAVKKLHAADALTVLADAHLHSVDYLEKAIAEFRQVLSSDPNNEAAHRGLGYAALYKNDFTEADRQFAQAVELNSQDPRVLYYSALLAERESQRTGGAQPNLGEMRTQLEKSIALDADFADAYDLLAAVEMQQGSPAAAIASEQKALKINPREQRYMLNYAQYLLADRKPDEAKIIFDHLAASDKPEIATVAKRDLENIKGAESESAAGAQVVIRPYPHKEWGTAPAAGGNAGSSNASDSNAKPVASEEVENQSAVKIEPEPEPVKTDPRPIAFLKGKLLSVDCSAPPAAVVTVAAGKRIWKMRTENAKKLVLLGTPSFSCDWKNQSVAVNYRAAGGAAGELVSLEIQ